jgi:hypothetical protein|tara:strand:- start:117 stop:341 length:225 start_codon:yes stop_codon:yes gene_type:complete
LREGEYHAPWDKAALDQWKMMICTLMRYHAADPGARLWQIPTEFIRNLDYGEGCQYSALRARCCLRQVDAGDLG